MQQRFLRPHVLRIAPVARAFSRRRALSGLGELGELGDALTAAQAIPDFVAMLKTYTVDKAGVVVSGVFDGSRPLAISISSAVAYWRMGVRGQLQPAQQANWNKWAAIASPVESDSHIFWTFGECLDQWGDQLGPAATEQQNAGIFADAKASECRYTLMDSTISGTTWYGGNVVNSALSNSQWSSVFRSAFDAICKGVIGGVLPFTYLDVLCKGMLAAPKSRRFPVWAPPGGVALTDPGAIAFRAAMKQYGWSGVVKLWFSYTQQAWAAQNEAYEAQDQSLSYAITGLNYLSGKKLLDSVLAKVNDYMEARAEAAQAILDFEKLKAGPLGSKIPAADIAAMDAIKAQFKGIDTQANGALAPVNLWPENTQVGVGYLGNLGIVQMVVGGVLLISLAGLLVWIITLMTSVARTAAAQTKATADSIIATVDEFKASCLRNYQASAKTPSDEAALQECLAKTEQLYKTIPPPPSGSDPLGLKYLAILGIVGVGGFLAYKHLMKKPQG